MVRLAWLGLRRAALVFALSRAGLLPLTVLALVAILTMPQRRLKLALLAGAVLGAIAVLQIPYIQTRFFRQLDPTYNQNTFEGRLQIWSDTLHMLRDHPILGAGLRAYTQVMAPYVSTHRIPQLYPHNVSLAMWSQIAPLRPAAFLALLVMLLSRPRLGAACSTP